MDDNDDSELPLNQQILNIQMELENSLTDVECDDRQKLIYDYLDRVLSEKLLIVDDFGSEVDWLNVATSLSLRQHFNGLLKVIDFFTYCCINCLHILPQLRLIESDFEDEGVVVVGVHSPKFNNEKDLTNVCDAVIKYNIDHPIANDPNGQLWARMDIQCWPTIVILGPDSQLLFTLMGENSVQQWLKLYIQTSLKYFQNKQLISTENKHKLPMKLLRHSFQTNLLGFPSKVSASEDKQLVAISNPRYHNIIIATTNGVVRHKIGGDEPDFRDGTLTTARFNAPNGLVWSGNTVVYVADTENHAIRRLDLIEGTVTTITGNGKQSEDTVGGKIGCEQGLNSPWDVCCDGDNRLFIAMAGSHQIWVLVLQNGTTVLNQTYDKGCCMRFAGDGSELNRNNRFPHKASFAQPSGLALDNTNNCLYVADSESSSIRCVDTINGCVTAVVGGDRNPQNLFAFGDRDGKGLDCRLQHCLGISLDETNQCLFVADSYNHKIKKIELSTKRCQTIAGTGVRGDRSDCQLFDCALNEPNGLCLINGDILLTDTNNHCLKRLDLNKEFVTEFKLFESKSEVDSTIAKPMPMNAKKVDSIHKLNPIIFAPKNELKLRLDLKFGSKIKLSEDMKSSFTFKNPDENLFSISDETIEAKHPGLLDRFSLRLNSDTLCEELLGTVCPLVITAKLNICDTELNYCKQIRVGYEIPLELSDNTNESILNIELPLDLTHL